MSGIRITCYLNVCERTCLSNVIVITHLGNVRPQLFPIPKHPRSTTVVEPSASFPASQQSTMLLSRDEQTNDGSFKELESSTTPEEVTNFVINSSSAAQEAMGSTEPPITDVDNSTVSTFS